MSEFPEPVLPAGAVPARPMQSAVPQQAAAARNPSPQAPAVPWSAPAPAKPAPIPEVAPIFDDEPAQMVEMSAWEDAAGISTTAKIVIAVVILVGVAGVIWLASFLFIWSKSHG